jgi:DNA-binding protein
MAYVTGVVMQLQQRPKVIIKARGKFISRAVDVSQMVTKRFVDNAKVTDIKVDSEEFENKEKRQVRVSNIELTVTKTK